MSHVQPSYDDFLRLFREEIDAHLHWQEAQSYYGVLSPESGWRMPVSTVIERMEELRERIPSPRFQQALADFYSWYGR
ncbi:MAG TPA: hypothetical protein VFA77_00775 [Candidatus Eisenbacteria bacterium]|nr:hypothetical protein [Candidatus Eisenbacteria bacterium]